LTWEAYYTSSAQRSTSTVALWQRYLHGSLGTVGGIAQDQVRALLCRFYQLSGVIARDRLDFVAALSYADDSLTLAEHLNNPELVTSSLHRRARSYVDMNRYDLALQDLERALPYARHSRDPLRSYVLICLAEVLSLLYPGDMQVEKRCLNLLDEVGRTVRTSHSQILAGDGSFTRVDVPGLYMVRSDVLRRFNHLNDAQSALVIVRQNLPRNLTRWHCNLLVADGQLCYAQGDYGGACDLALEGLAFVDETNSSSTRVKIERLYASLAEHAPRNASVLTLGERLGLVLPGGNQ
jgi:hypothetical protein